MLEYSEIIQNLQQTSKAYISSTGYSVWSEKIIYCIENGTLYIVCDEIQTLKNLNINPRVTLSFENESNTRCSGILHIVPQLNIPSEFSDKISADSICYELTPYRFYNSGKEILERRKEGWTQDTLKQEKAWYQLSLKNQFEFWKKATRAISLPLSFYPIILGGLLAWTVLPINFFVLLAALIGGISAHFGINLISDYYDYKRGVDTPDALSSHVSVLVDELMDPDNALLGALACLFLTALSGGYLILSIGFPVLVIGTIGVFAGYTYTGGLFGLKYRGFGEILIFFLMGPLMFLGTYYVLAGNITLAGLLLSSCVGLLVASVTLSNNLRDMLYDKTAGYYTLPARIGIPKAKKLYSFIIFLPYLLVLCFVLTDIIYLPALLVVFSIPQALHARQAMRETENTELAFYQNSAKYKYPLNSIIQHSKFCFFLALGLIIVKIIQFFM